MFDVLNFARRDKKTKMVVAKKSSVEPFAKIHGYAVSGVEPKFFGITFVNAVKFVLKK